MFLVTFDVKYKSVEVYRSSSFIPIDSTDEFICEHVLNFVKEEEDFEDYLSYIYSKYREKPILRELETFIPLPFADKVPYPFNVNNAMDGLEELEIHIQVREAIQRDLLGA